MILISWRLKKETRELKAVGPQDFRKGGYGGERKIMAIDQVTKWWRQTIEVTKVDFGVIWCKRFGRAGASV